MSLPNRHLECKHTYFYSTNQQNAEGFSKVKDVSLWTYLKERIIVLGKYLQLVMYQHCSWASQLPAHVNLHSSETNLSWEACSHHVTWNDVETRTQTLSNLRPSQCLLPDEPAWDIDMTSTSWNVPVHCTGRRRGKWRVFLWKEYIFGDIILFYLNQPKSTDCIFSQL